MDRIFANATPRKFDYVLGQTLEIPVEDGGQILLKGEVFRLRPSFSAESYPVTPKPDEIVLSKLVARMANIILLLDVPEHLSDSGNGRRLRNPNPS